MWERNLPITLPEQNLLYRLEFVFLSKSIYIYTINHDTRYFLVSHFVDFFFLPPERMLYSTFLWARRVSFKPKANGFG